MASSFDEVSHEDRTYREVMALYAAIKDTPGIIRVRRAEMRQGEVKAECIDFVIDVELKAKKAVLYHIAPEYAYAQWLRIVAAPDKYESLSASIRKELGAEFLATGLGVDGAYRMLYWRAKNNKRDLPKEDTNGIFE